MTPPKLSEEIKESLNRAGVFEHYHHLALGDPTLQPAGKEVATYLAKLGKRGMKGGRGFNIVTPYADKGQAKERIGHSLFMAGFRTAVMHGIRCYLISLTRLDDILKRESVTGDMPQQLIESDMLGIMGFCDGTKRADDVYPQRQRLRIEELIRYRLDRNRCVCVTTNVTDWSGWWSKWLEQEIVKNVNQTFTL